VSTDVSSPIFISYASIDQDVAETICDALQARGHPCWIACRNIAPGENFQESIVRAIRSARVMLLIFTSNANNSDEIKKELVLAGRHRVTVLPVRVEDVVPNDAFAYEFATRQWIDLFKDWEREIDRLGAQIGTIIAAPRAGESAGVATARPAPRSSPGQKPAQTIFAQKPSYGPLAAAACVIVAALGAGGLYLYTRGTPPPPANMAANAPASAAAVSPPPAAAPAPSQAAVAQPAPPPQPALQPSMSAPTRAFDGAWAITFSCAPFAGALGYSYRVAAQVSDGLLHGEKGEKGKPGWLTIDGKIGADGSLNNLYVDSLVGASQMAVGNVAKGTEFGYHIAGTLNGASGSASRVEGRPCTLDFAKQ
jgi:hypothetical protein